MNKTLPLSTCKSAGFPCNFIVSSSCKNLGTAGSAECSTPWCSNRLNLRESSDLKFSPLPFGYRRFPRAKFYQRFYSKQLKFYRQLYTTQEKKIKDFYIFTFRQRGREGKKHQHVRDTSIRCLSQAHNPGMRPHWELNQ